MPRRWIVWFTALAAHGVVLRESGAQRLTPGAVSAILDTLVPAAVARYHVPGAVIAIVRRDSVIALRGFGFARLEDSVPADPSRSIYRLASVAKLFVAATVLDEAGKGAIDLSRDIRTYAPDIPIPDTYPAPITLAQLLTHTAGFDERMIGYGAPSRETMRAPGDYLRERLPDRGWEPGQLVSYSNHGMALAAYVAERVSKTPFSALAAARVFGPLGMTRSFYIAPSADSLSRDLAPGYRCGASGCERAPVVWSHLYSVGLAFSSALDMSRFMRAQLHGGVLDGRQALPESTVVQMQRRQFTHDARIPGMGYAFFEQFRNGTRVLSHAGGVPGFATLLSLAPAESLGVFIATNAGEPDLTRDVMNAVLDALAPASVPLPPSATGSVSEYAGAYRLTRYSHRTIERFPGAFAFAATAVAHGDTLRLIPGGEGHRFVRVDSLLLRQVDGDDLMAVRRDSAGRITHLFTGSFAFERRPWYEGSHFLNEYASYLVGLPVVVLFVWGVVAAGLGVWRKRRGVLGADSPARSLRMTFLVVAVVNEALLLAFMFGFVARTTRDLSAGRGITFGMTAPFELLLQLPWVVLVASAVVVVGAVFAWRRQWWSKSGRVCYSTLAMLAIGAMHFLVWWGYVPARW